MILAIDTSTALTSVALVDGQDIVMESVHLDPRQHAEVLAPMLRDAVARVGRDHITVVACGVGPGPYTGLRVGIASALALGAAWGLPVVGLCSLDALATAAIEAGIAGPFGVAVDARRAEVYWARYSAEGTREEGPMVGAPSEVPERASRWVGAGALVHAADFGEVVGGSAPELLHPHASRLARRVQALLDGGHVAGVVEVPLAAHGTDGAATSAALLGRDLLPPVPLYLRRPDAVEPRRA